MNAAMATASWATASAPPTTVYLLMGQAML
jgi:hypothetical protein